MIKKQGKNIIVLLKKDFSLKNTIPSQENNININEEKKKTLELIEKEIKQVDEMINVTEKILEKMDKHTYILPDDIIGNDKSHKYIGIKSNDEISPNIRIIDEDDLENKNMNMNKLEEIIKENLNLKMHLNVDNNNNIFSNDYFEKMIYDENQDNKNQLNSNILKDNSFPPIELCLMSPQDRIIDYNNK